MSLNELAKEAHQIAVEHGFWDPEPSFGDLVALMHSELSEALEEYRAGNRIRPGEPTPMVYYSGRGYVATDTTECCKKPEGIAVELADCIIRILDWAGHEGTNVDYYIKTMESTRDHKSVFDEDFGDFISFCHTILSNAYIQKDELGRGMCLCLEIIYILEWAEKERVDMEAVIREKMEYNRTRPYRHGGKLL